jgi:hypothetical protein
LKGTECVSSELSVSM